MTTTTKTVEFVVPDLCCIECSQGVVTTLRQAPGVCDVRVLGLSEKVLVTYDETTRPEMLVQAALQARHPVTSWWPEGQAEPQPTGAPTSSSRTWRVQTWARLRLLIVGFVSLIALFEIALESLGLLHSVEELVPWPLALTVVVIGGYPIFRGAGLSLRQRHINTDAVMSVGILAAAAIHEFIAAALIVFFVVLAHSLEDKTTGRARRAIAELAELAPQTARVKRGIGEEVVSISELSTGNVVVVREGEQVPIDGIVLTGHAIVNQAAITGESLPVDKLHGDEVFAATMVERGYLEVRVERVGEKTALGRITHLVEEAEAQKSPVQKFADRFSAAFLPLVLSLAALTLLISHNLTAAIAVLVAACPCAVGLATPLSVVAAVGAGARRGLLIKGGLALETLAKVDTLVVDKTGTLTSGHAQVTEIVPCAEMDQDAILALAAALEQRASHPLATAILGEAERRGLNLPELDDSEMLPSRGIVGHHQGQFLLLGSRRLLVEQGITLTKDQEQRVATLEQEGKTILVLAQSHTVVGVLAVADTIRVEVADALMHVRRLGIRRIVLLTGDNERVARAVANAACITEYKADLLPEDKITAVMRLQAEGCRVLMVGDGINDAPALTQANVGIAMGGIGTAIAQEAADVALLRDDWMAVPEAIRLSRRTYRTIRQNIYFGIGFTTLVMGLASFGVIGPIVAAASQSIPDVAVAINASRLLGGAAQRRALRSHANEQAL